jgi:mono/diheme cytochrome c family protein
LSRAWIRKVIANPNTPDCFGLTRLVDEMPAFEEDLSATELEELTEYLASLSGEPYTPNIDMEKAQRGAALFGEGECAGCHEVTREESVGPAFGGYGSRTWLKALLQNPTHPAYYGEAGDGMPAYTDLTARELNYLTTWLLSLKHDRPAEGGARQ